MKRERVDTGGGGEVGEFEISLAERARRLAEIETEPVQERMLFKRIRSVGRVSYDETRYKMVSAWIDGRIDKLFADFTGMTVSKGDHLAEIYSPELLSAQEEYLQAVRSAASTSSTQTDIARRSSQQVLSAARRKLELLGITDEQVSAIGQSGQPQTHLVIHAPLGGTVLKKQAMEGMYVKTGDPLYTIADLRHLWLLVDLYESDLPWVKPFQQVRVTTRSLPGEVFTGEIFFVDPSVDPQTRTVEVRIHVDNPAMRLKPDMWVTAAIDAGLARGGRGTVPNPGGDFACPMHPWETADESGHCSVCEMEMVPITELPQYAPPTDAIPLLSVPRDAPMQTGERALVYVESAPGIYRGVEVTLGPLARGDDGREYYPILSGLSGGEQVVTRGNFAIDSQMQLAGKPSLFTARGFGADQDKAAKELGHASHMARPSTSAGEIEQTHCPVMGGKINPEVFIEYKGVKVYFCCWGCDDKFLAEPEEYIPKLPESIQKRIRAADSAVPATQGTANSIEQITCPVMGGEIDPKVSTDYHGVRVYFCCPPCIKKFEADPKQYIPRLPEPMRTKLAAMLPKEAGHD
jgi:Cu(I)/Ag(I) efflux system membrane fusion protein